MNIEKLIEAAIEIERLSREHESALLRFSKILDEKYELIPQSLALAKLVSEQSSLMPAMMEIGHAIVDLIDIVSESNTKKGNKED